MVCAHISNQRTVGEVQPAPRGAIKACRPLLQEERRNDDEIRSIISEFDKQFSTLVVEVETHLLGNADSKDRSEMEEQLDKIIAFMEKNETLGEVKYFKRAKNELKAEKNDEAMAKEKVQNCIMEAKLSILERELATKKELFQNSDIDNPEIVAFMPDFHFELRQIGRIICHWKNNADTITDYLKKAEELLRLANKVIKPLKENAGKLLEVLISQPQEITNELFSLIDNKENLEDLDKKMQEKAIRIKVYGEMVMEVAQLIDMPKLAKIRKTVKEMEEAANELERNPIRYSKVIGKIRQLQKLLKYEKKHFVDRPYQIKLEKDSNENI